MALANAFPMQMMRNFQILMDSQETYYAYTRAGGYERVAEPRLFLNQLVDFNEASAPVKKQEGEETGHTIHCEH